jgi:hypothetical protein
MPGEPESLLQVWLSSFATLALQLHLRLDRLTLAMAETDVTLVRTRVLMGRPFGTKGLGTRTVRERGFSSCQ